MKNISIAIPKQGALISSIVRLFKIFNQANQHELKRAKPMPFLVNLVADAEVVNLYGGRYTLKPGRQLKDISKTDLVIIPAMAGNIAEELQKDKDLQQWITKQYQHGAEIACLCTSVFLLPGTRLLRKKHCIKKWFVSNDFRQQFSQVNLIVEDAVMDEQQIYTNGGEYSFIDGLIKSLAGSDAATTSSAIFETEFNRECQSLAVILRERQKYQQVENKGNIRQVTGDPFYTTSAEDFTAMLNLNREDHVDKVLYDYLMKANNSSNKIAGSPNLHINDETNGKAYNNRKVFRQMLGKINAGMAATVTGNSVNYWVWTEWFPIGAIQVTNFPIKPGDYLTVLVCANQPNHGFCSILNKTTNQATSIGIIPPDKTTSIGATAEWIVEGISSILPVFSTVVFSNCSAGTKNHKMNTNGGVITEITGTGGANLTAASILSSTSCMVKWLKSS